MDRDEILLLIDAPSNHVVVDDLSLSGTWLALQVRACQSLTINGYTHIFDFMNDAFQFCTSNITANHMQVESEVAKKYNNQNHPDVGQFFSWKKGQPLSNIEIKKLDVYLRNTPKHGGLTGSEDGIIEKLFVGREGLIFDTDAAESDLWANFINLRRSVLGHPDANVSGKGVRVKDVKHFGGYTNDDLIFVGLPPESLDIDGQFTHV